MTNKEFFVKCLEQEHPIFLRVLNALPKAKLEYRPHDRSKSAGEILETILGGEKTGVQMVKKGEFNYEDKELGLNFDEIIEAYQGSHNELKMLVKKVDESTWRDKKVKLSYQGQFLYDQPLGDFMWMMLFDQVHHRGQLSSYIRPMGGKVPSIYGPSGDDPGK